MPFLSWLSPGGSSQNSQEQFGWSDNCWVREMWSVSCVCVSTYYGGVYQGYVCWLSQRGWLGKSEFSGAEHWLAHRVRHCGRYGSHWPTPKASSLDSDAHVQGGQQSRRAGILTFVFVWFFIDSLSYKLRCPWVVAIMCCVVFMVQTRQIGSPQCLSAVQKTEFQSKLRYLDDAEHEFNEVDIYMSEDLRFGVKLNSILVSWSILWTECCYST